MLGYFYINIEFYYDNKLNYEWSFKVFKDIDFVKEHYNKTIKGNTFEELWDIAPKYFIGYRLPNGYFTKARRIGGITFRNIVEGKTEVKNFSLQITYEDISDTVTFKDLQNEKAKDVLWFFKDRGFDTTCLNHIRDEV